MVFRCNAPLPQASLLNALVKQAYLDSRKALSSRVRGL